MLDSLLGWMGNEHYLDDFILVLPPANTATPERIRVLNRDYNDLTDFLGLLRNPKKDTHGLVVKVLGIEIDTFTMQARPPSTQDLQINFSRELSTHSRIIYTTGHTKNHRFPVPP